MAYHTNGSGRDVFIAYNNGGFDKSLFSKFKARRTGFSEGQSRFLLTGIGAPPLIKPTAKSGIPQSQDPYRSVTKLSYPRYPKIKPDASRLKRGKKPYRRAVTPSVLRRRGVTAPDGTFLPRDAYQRSVTPNGRLRITPVSSQSPYQAFDFPLGRSSQSTTLPFMNLDPPQIPQYNPFGYPGHMTQGHNMPSMMSATSLPMPNAS